MERADDTARLIDVYVHRMLGETGADSDAACRALFGILGVPVEPDAELDVDVVLFRLVYETQSPSAIAGSMLGARAGARGIREVISSEMWECLNVTAHALAGQKRAAERLGPHVYLRYIRERSALFFGLADSTMSHDDAWRFLVLGRSLERADMTARLLLARMSAPDDLGWPVLLRACGAHESLHPHPRLGRRVGPGRGVPAARPALPAQRGARADHRGGVPGGAEPGPDAGPGSTTRRGARSGGCATGLSTPTRSSSPAQLPELLSAPCRRPACRRARRSPSGTSSTRRRSPGNGAAERGLATAHRAHHQRHVRGPGADLVQRGADDPADAADADHPSTPG